MIKVGGELKNETNLNNNEIILNKKDESSISSRSSRVAKDIFTDYPSNFTVTELISTLEIKQIWLYNEWDIQCQFSVRIRPHFSKREDLDPKKLNPDIELIESIFHEVRGKWYLWQSPRENGKWRKFEVSDLKLDWVLTNIEVLFDKPDRFPVTELTGIVLWDDKNPRNEKKFKLYEGNHRICAWITACKPASLPATIFIGEPV